MGLDQYLFDSSKPNPLNPLDPGTKLAYWREDWYLQGYIDSGNCENFNISIDYCNELLDNLDSIYFPHNTYRAVTYKAFTKVREILIAGGRITYHGNW